MHIQKRSPFNKIMDKDPGIAFRELDNSCTRKLRLETSVAKCHDGHFLVTNRRVGREGFMA